MMFERFTARERRYWAIWLMFLTIVSLIVVGVMPLVSEYYANQARIVGLQQQLQRYNAQILNRPAVMTKTAELKSTILEARVFSVQKSIPLSLAELQEKITAVIAKSGGNLSSTQNVAQSSVDGLTKLGINASFSGKVGQLKQILFELESAKPYVMFENIKIYAPDRPRGSQNRIDAANTINVVADIVTYIPSEPK